MATKVGYMMFPTWFIINFGLFVKLQNRYSLKF
jgi:hypothetical protein